MERFSRVGLKHGRPGKLPGPVRVLATWLYHGHKMLLFKNTQQLLYIPATLLMKHCTAALHSRCTANRSGKLQVLVKVLAAWASEGHKVLLFTQTQQMLDIIEKHVVEAGYSYHRMDGNTPIASRGRLMDDFNNNPDRCDT